MSPLDPLLDWYRTLRRDSVAGAVEFYDQAARFKDPFNDVQGVDAIMAIFDHMFATTEAPHFIILDTVASNDQAFVTWLFEFGLRGKPYQVRGATHFRFNAAGKITEHRDYWDAAEELLQKLPLIGAPMRWLWKQFAVQTERVR